MAGLKAFEKQFIRDGVVDEPRLLQAQAAAERGGGFSGDAIIKLGYADAPSVYQSLARFCELRFVSLATLDLPEALLRKVPARFATHYRCMPVEEREGVLVVAISDPLNAHLLDDIRLVLKQRLEAVVATPDDIKLAIKRYYGVGADTMERMLHQQEGSTTAAPVRRENAVLDDDQIDASIIKFVNELILESVKSGATDIHIEPFEDELRVRFRIDGILHQVPAPRRIQGFQAAIVSRVKIMANLNIAEKRLPQDGKILASFGAESYDLRVSILPTPHGETVNMRVLTRSNAFLTLPELGFRQEDLAQFNGFINKPHGILLVTGPTGSGKTTTLYAALSKLNNLERKIITIEDPVEYQLAGVTQMQVHNQIGFDFAMGLRSILRHDPDVLLVGEIRDYETAEMAVRSSLTGHLVLSTLHTNDSAGAVTRLLDMGVEPFLISSTMIAAIAQRLLRKNCEACARPVDYDASLLAAEFGDVAAEVPGATFRRGDGCAACRNTGYRGRAAIYEMLPFTPDIKTLTVQRATSLAIKQVALRQGMRTLRRAGWLRACEGATTIEEVLRVTADADVLLSGEGGDAQFRYEAKKGPDEKLSGVLEAENQRAAVARLREMGCFPLDVTRVDDEAGARQGLARAVLHRVRLKDRNIFFRQLANLIESGMMLTQALRTIAKQAENPGLAAMTDAVREEVQKGSTLSDALAKQGKLFPPLYINLVHAGETGGMLDDVLWRIVAFGEQEEELRGKAFSALVYPVFLSIISAISVFILVSFVFPRFIGIFKEFDAALPWPTLIVMGICQFMGTWWWAVLLGLGGSIWALVQWLRTEAGRTQWDTAILRVPVVKLLVQKYEMAKFARTFGTLLDNGVPILTTLEITAGAMGNRVIQEEVRSLHSGVMSGGAMSEGLQQCKHFPPVVVSMFAVGEESGRIGAVANRIADAYDIEVERAAKAVMALFEPLLIVVMGVIIGFLVIAMLLPMLTLSSAIGA